MWNATPVDAPVALTSSRVLPQAPPEPNSHLLNGHSACSPRDEGRRGATSARRNRMRVAKVTRDRIMHALAPRYPTYAWETNVGYATSAHLGGLEAYGMTPHHRRSFVASRQLSLDFGGQSFSLDAAAALADAMEQQPGD
jgi:ribonuclease HII